MGKLTGGNQSTQKVLSIIECLAERGEPMRLNEISATLGINTSTTLRYLITLIDCGYVLQDPSTAQYTLTLKLYFLAERIDFSSGLRRAAMPYLRSLSKTFGETAHLSIDQNSTVVYIASAHEGSQIIGATQRIGTIAPLHCTGAGKLFLTQYGDKQVRDLIQVHGLPKFTEKTITSLEKLMEELRTVEEKGYAMDNEECEIGARCVSVPIRGKHGNVEACISISGPAVRLTDAHIEENLPLLLKACEQVGRDLYSELKV